jgi:hypothetical protein
MTNVGLASVNRHFNSEVARPIIVMGFEIFQRRNKPLRTLSYLVCFAVLLLAMPVFAQDAITYDEAVTGEITNDTPEISYTFEGNVGDTITISMTAVGAQFDTYLHLLGPDGEEVAVNDDSGGMLNSLIGPLSLPEDGTYTIVATRCCPPNTLTSGSSGTFELVIRETELSPLALSETVTVALDDENPNAFFTFEGSVAEPHIYSLVAETEAGDVNFLIDVLNPNGQSVAQGWQNNNATVYIDPLLLNVEGPYVFKVSRQPNAPNGEPISGPVRLSFTLQEVETQAIAVGDTVTGTLDDANPSDHYTFSGSQDELLRLVGSQPPDNQAFEGLVYSPEGFTINSSNSFYGENPGSFTLDPLQLFATGEYLLFVRRIDTDGSGELGTTEYTITLSPSETPTLESGVAVENRMGGQTFERVYRYNGSAGETIRITLRGTSDTYAPSLNVQGPNAGDTGMEGGAPGFYLNIGGNAPGTAIYEVTLPQDGVYLFRVNNGVYSETGPVEGAFSLLIETVE